MKKLINDPANVVREELEGIEAAHSDLVKVQYDPYLIIRADAPVQGKVALISGGGSGMSRCTEASSGRACWMPPVPARSSPRRRPTRWRPRRRPWTAAPA